MRRGRPTRWAEFLLHRDQEGDGEDGYGGGGFRGYSELLRVRQGIRRDGGGVGVECGCCGCSRSARPAIARR